MKKIRLTPEKELYNFCTPYIIAEIGSNHNGDMILAKEMILSAKACGVDAVKFQSWSPATLIAREEYERNTKYNDSPKKHFGSLREMCERYYLRPEQHYELKEFCDENQIDFCSSPFANHEVKPITTRGRITSTYTATEQVKQIHLPMLERTRLPFPSLPSIPFCE